MAWSFRKNKHQTETNDHRRRFKSTNGMFTNFCPMSCIYFLYSLYGPLCFTILYPLTINWLSYLPAGSISSSTWVHNLLLCQGNNGVSKQQEPLNYTQIYRRLFYSWLINWVFVVFLVSFNTEEDKMQLNKCILYDHTSNITQMHLFPCGLWSSEI